MAKLAKKEEENFCYVPVILQENLTLWDIQDELLFGVILSFYIIYTYYEQILLIIGLFNFIVIDKHKTDTHAYNYYI